MEHRFQWNVLVARIPSDGQGPDSLHYMGSEASELVCASVTLTLRGVIDRAQQLSFRQVVSPNPIFDDDDFFIGSFVEELADFSESGFNLVVVAENSV